MKVSFVLPWLFLIAVCSNIGVISASCLSDQQSLLLQLKNSLVYDAAKSRQLVRWNETSSDCCSWDGITCDKKGHVTGLSLKQESITGGLFDNSSLFDLQHLKTLDLSSNEFQSTVPGRIGELAALTSLKLANCSLISSFPPEIFQVPTLQFIDLSQNELLQGSLPEFPKNNAFQELVLSNTKFSGSLPVSIGSLWNLSRLDLSRCKFSGEIPTSMGKLTRLIHLDLSENKLIGHVPSFKMSKKLTILSLQYNNLNGSIPPSLFLIPSLGFIDMSNNQFDGKLLEFHNVSSPLFFLNLSNNHLQGPIPMSIFKLTELEFLDLSSNRFNGSIYLDKIQGPSELFSIDLSYNHLAAIASDMKNSWPSFSNLESLVVASNKLKFLPNLMRQSNLVHLDLSNNDIEGWVPNWIWKDNLKYLNLSCNSLHTIQEPYFIPSNFYKIDLHQNHLQGKIPNQILSRSFYVDLSRNDFTCCDPINVNITVYFVPTKFLSLAHNDIKGTLPASICKLNNLEILDLYNNSFSGKIPECLFVMDYIEVLQLGQNNFIGRIPDAFSVESYLSTLDLNGNSIEGVIPKSLVNCIRLEILNLGSNYLSGEFPCSLKKITTLRVLILRSNKFYGRIKCPNFNKTWETLQVVDLAHNNFDGTLPEEIFRQWQAKLHIQSDISYIEVFNLYQADILYHSTITIIYKGKEMHIEKVLTIFTSIDLSSNHFVGPIPDDVGLLRALYFLNLSNNALIGRIPTSIGNMGQVESLDLSCNKLSGSIPISLASLNFLSLLNLSYNSLVGPIPLGNQIQTFPSESFIGNKALWGCPLTKNCTAELSLPNIMNQSYSNTENGTNWNLISVEIGFLIGFGVVIAPLVFCKRWRKQYFERIDDIGVRLFPRLYQISLTKNKTRRRRRGVGP